MIEKLTTWFGSVTMGVVCLFYSVFKPKEFLSMWYLIKDKFEK